MPNAVWTGTLSFGLVILPVRLYPATEPKDVRFHLYDQQGRRVRYQRVVDVHEQRPEDPGPPPTGPAVPRETPVEAPIGWDQVVRGIENDEGDVVTLTHEELERVRPQRSRSIDIEDFVDLADIDPVYFEKSYYAVPQRLETAKPYVLLHRAMRRAGRIGIGRFVLRTKPHLVAVRPMDDVLAVQTLFFGDEVRDARTLVPDLQGVRVEERELELAIGLIDMLKTEWDRSAYADEYRQDLLRILAAKTPATQRPEEPVARSGGSAVEELMAALKESVEAAKRMPKRSGKRAAG